MKEILLFNPSFNIKSLEFSENIPVNLLSLGSFLEENGYNVHLVDGCAQKDYKERIKAYAKQADFLGIGLMTIQIPGALEISKIVKEINSNIKTIFGGIHPTLFPEQTAKHPLVDFVVKGEGELTFSELVDAIEKNKSVRNVKGLCFSSKDRVVNNQNRAAMDVNTLPSPHWNLIDENVLNLYKTKKTNKALLLHTSRGCPHRCTFCINVCTNNQLWRGRKASLVVDEIEYIVNELKVDSIKFRDECFFVNKQRVKDILKGAVERKLDFRWEGNSRVDYFSNGVVDDEVFSLMQKTNCYEMDFGVESGSQRMLDKMKKDIKLQHVINVVKKLTPTKIHSTYSFMIGLPGETKEDMKKTILFMKYIKKLNPGTIKVLGPQPYRPYPGGEMYKEALALGWKEPSKLEDWEGLYDENKISISAKNFPWVKDHSFLDSIWLFNGFALSTWDNTLKMTGVNAPKIFLLMFAIDAKLRWKLGIYDHFYEMKIVNLFNRLINKN